MIWLAEQLDCATGRPVENAYIRSFNGKFRDECLNENWFIGLGQALEVIEAWRLDYNRDRAHGSRGHLTPREYRQRWTSQEGGQIEPRI